MTDPHAGDNPDFEPKTPEPTEKRSSDAMKSDASGERADAPGWERATLEKLAFAYLQEQRASRRWRIGLRVAWLVLIAFVAWGLFNRGTPHADPSTPHTALVEIRGEISADGEARAEYINAAMRAALEDTGSRGLILLVDSPGGSPVQAGIINDEILRLRKLHQKPIHVVVEDSCASAAYYVAVAADRIHVDKASIVGSIGVLMDSFGFTGAMEKLGIERRLMTAGENKGFLDPFSPQTPAQKAYTQTLLNQIHLQFIEVVKKGRGQRLKETPEMFSGLFWSGQQAIEMGLADAYGTVDSVARDVIGAAEIVDYTRHENVAERLFKRFGAAIGEGAVRALRESVVIR